MKDQINAGATAGIEQEVSPAQLAAMMETIRRLEAENKAFREKAEAQEADLHANPGTANESTAASKERFAIIVEEGRDENDMNPIYVGVNGRGYSIRRGEVVEVPAEVMNVLNDAVEVRSIPVERNGQPAGITTREARRFPYRNFGKVVDADGKRLNVALPEGVGA